jgi:hypothetical protein
MSWQGFVQRWFTLKRGPAHRVIFYYPGEEPTYLDDAFVTVFRNGVVEVEHRNEHVSTHVQNVEILWKNRSPQPGTSGRSLSLVKQEDASPELR